LDKYLVPLLLIGMVATTGGTLLESLRTKSRRQAVKNALRDEVNYLFKRKPKK
jgi:hypothetical protein